MIEVIKKDVKNGFCYFMVSDNGSYGIARCVAGSRLDRKTVNYNIDYETAKKKFNHTKMYS